MQTRDFVCICGLAFCSLCQTEKSIRCSQANEIFLRDDAGCNFGFFDTIYIFHEVCKPTRITIHQFLTFLDLLHSLKPACGPHEGVVISSDFADSINNELPTIILLIFRYATSGLLLLPVLGLLVVYTALIRQKRILVKYMHIINQILAQ